MTELSTNELIDQMAGAEGALLRTLRAEAGFTLLKLHVEADILRYATGSSHGAIHKGNTFTITGSCPTTRFLAGLDLLRVYDLRALDAHYDAREPVTTLHFAVYLPAKRLADTGAD